MEIREETFKFAKINRFEFQTMKMGMNRIASIMVDDFKGLTVDKNIKRLIMINELYLEARDNYELSLSETELNDKIIEGIRKFLDSNSSIYLSSVDNENININNMLCFPQNLNNEMLDKKVFEQTYNLVVNKSETIFDSSKIVEEKYKSVFKDAYSEKEEIFDNIKNTKYYTLKINEMVLYLREKGLSTQEIRNILKFKCRKELVDIYDKREELIEKNRERSKYLKRKYGKKN